MGNNRTHDKLDKLFADKKARNFINHLIRSYVPMNKVKKVMDVPEDKNKFKCVLCNQPLVSINELLDRLESDEHKNEFTDNLKNLFKDGDERYKVDEKLLGKQSLGVQGQNTDTYMSMEAFQEFYDWVVTKMLMGDKHINWVLGKINKNKFKDRAKHIDNLELEQEIEKTSTTKKATYTLGDLSALQELKRKMDSEK
jgi:hypothetical protein